MKEEKIFCDADVWIKLCRVDKIDLLFSLFNFIYMADVVVDEIINWRDPETKHNKPSFYLEGKRNSKTLQVISLKNDFTSLQQKNIQLGFAQLEATSFVKKEQSKNHGEIYTALYAQEMCLKCMLSDDKHGREIIEENFDLKITDHYEVIYQSIEMNLIDTESAKQLYIQIENLPGSSPKRMSFEDMMTTVKVKLELKAA